MSVTSNADAPGTVSGARSVFRLPFLRWGLVALLQLGLIAIPLADRLQVQMTGTVVPLELIPVDPRDLLRGDYVIINLAIGQVPANLPGGETVEAGDQVFVGLTRDGDKPAEPAVLAKAREQAGSLAISGTVLSKSEEEIRIDYGIDAFFLPEGEGRIIERLETARVLLEVSIAEDGRSLPVTLLVDGKAFRSDSIF
ncbi:GDYXXLXY domain-containing protein [Roseibium salinum]|uniref:GDYXXLXY domain-containing protein n=1 Tax=Roseibium salinum TaxID=1604349 RepID=A0ABT3R2R1_9HYPH|nr:GDYXXLXY domain-containing protein [Roseibium sp. DSM 29163]MCX2723537.1 GDYXXLXY domain-containing protein [Roseibium sp. DSM 29163]